MIAETEIRVFLTKNTNPKFLAAVTRAASSGDWA